MNIKTPKSIEIAINGCFSIIEAQFHLRNVNTNNTKFYMMIVSLPAYMVAKIPPFILESQNYEELKKTITKSHERMKPEFLKKLISTATITERPSAYLQEMLPVVKHLHISNDIVLHDFLQALLQSIVPGHSIPKRPKTIKTR